MEELWFREEVGSGDTMDDDLCFVRCEFEGEVWVGTHGV